jgi:hypothetical protein
MRGKNMKKGIVVGIIILFVGLCFQPAFANDVSIDKAEQLPRGETFIKRYGGSRWDRGNYVQQTSDGGYIITGQTKSYGVAESWDVWLIKTDNTGNIIWDKTFGGPNWEFGLCVQQTTDGGYIIVGARDGQNGTEDVWLIKTDSDGNKIWYKTFRGPEDERGEFVQQTSDGGYIIVGGTESYGHVFYSDVWLIKTDSNGNMEWDKTFGDVLADWGECVQQTNDGGYILIGTTEEFGKYNDDILLIKTDDAGNQEWIKTFGDSGDDAGYCVQQTTDGGYIITGEINLGFLRTGICLIKTDRNGNIVWEKTFGGVLSYNCGYSVQQTTDGGYIITGEKTSLFGNFEEDVWLIKTNSFGIKVWEKSFGGINDDVGNCIQQTNDGGYIITGTTDSHDWNDDDVLLIKTDSNGKSTNKALKYNMFFQRFLERFPLLEKFFNHFEVK